METKDTYRASANSFLPRLLSVFECFGSVFRTVFEFALHKEKIFETTKAELVQVNHTPIICLKNVTNKKVGNRKN